MVRIRLRRVGAKKQPHYRVVVADQRSPRDGRHIEVIGHYNPRTEPETVKIKEDRALYWLSKGAQPSDAVLRFLEKQGTMTRLVRLNAGESLEALVAEYEAVDEAEAVVETAAAEETPAVEVEVEAAEETAAAEETPTAEVKVEAAVETAVTEVEAAVETAAAEETTEAADAQEVDDAPIAEVSAKEISDDQDPADEA